MRLRGGRRHPRPRRAPAPGVLRADHRGARGLLGALLRSHPRPHGPGPPRAADRAAGRQRGARRVRGEDRAVARQWQHAAVHAAAGKRGGQLGHLHPDGGDSQRHRGLHRLHRDHPDLRRDPAAGCLRAIRPLRRSPRGAYCQVPHVRFLRHRKAPEPHLGLPPGPGDRYGAQQGGAPRDAEAADRARGHGPQRGGDGDAGRRGRAELPRQARRGHHDASRGCLHALDRHPAGL
mmetsp:Transcript_72778/g.213483  ORF Transcript_72778/g.213483 Transcript_72778/m.213483 type:complete len:234 (-) Transcript_72778:598-1299(-)